VGRVFITQDSNVSCAIKTSPRPKTRRQIDDNTPPNRRQLSTANSQATSQQLIDYSSTPIVELVNFHGIHPQPLPHQDDVASLAGHDPPPDDDFNAWASDNFHQEFDDRSSTYDSPEAYFGSAPPVAIDKFSCNVCKTPFPSRNKLFSHLRATKSADLDVSTVRFLSTNWSPGIRDASPPKKKEHRAMDDIKESIAELKYYKESLWSATQE
jgi:hypothetical protein